VLCARELFAALLKARRALDRYPAGHPLRQGALVELARCARRVLARGPLTVRLEDGDLWLGDARVLPDLDGFGSDLSTAGVRELTLTIASVPCGVLGLAELCSSAASCRARRMRLAAGVLPGVSTRLSA
jgi:hypothetical protein